MKTYNGELAMGSMRLSVQTLGCIKVDVSTDNNCENGKGDDAGDRSS